MPNADSQRKRSLSRLRVVALPVVAVAVVWAVFGGGSTASADGGDCLHGQITFNSAPALSDTAPSITSSSGSWTSCQIPFTGFYKEWLRNGSVFSGPTWVSGALTNFSYTVQEPDMTQALTSGVQPCNSDGCYGSYVGSSNSITPTYEADYLADELEEAGSFSLISSEEARGGELPGVLTDVEDAGPPAEPAGEICWSTYPNTPYVSKGRWGFQRKVKQFTNWCARTGNHLITYRRTSTSTEVGWFCGTTSREQWKVGGGINFLFVTMHSGAEFSCNLHWAPDIHSTGWLEVKYEYGARSIVASRRP